MRTPRRSAYSGIVFVSALALYAVSAGVTLARGSLAPHYVYLAAALLRGQLHLDPLPPVTYDLILFQDRWYVAGAPFPAVLLLPFVALRGLAVSDIPFGVLVGAINAVLVYELLGQLGAALAVGETARRWLTALFAAGTAHWYLAALGSYWFNAHVVAVMFVTLYVRATLTQKRGWLAGLWLALAGLTRPTTLFAAAFFVAWTVMRSRAWREVLRRLGPFATSVGAGVAVTLAYNAARFGNPLDFGYAYVQGAANITRAFARYGGFNLSYLPCNLYVSLAGLPDVLGQSSPVTAVMCRHLLLDFPLRADNAWLSPNPVGMSVFLVTPALLYVFRARRREPPAAAAWLGLLAVAVPLWLYHNTGSLQFGYRYSLDTAPFLMILAASGMRGRCGWLERALIGLSILVNFAGLAWMFSARNGLGWFAMWRGLLLRGG